MVLADPLKVGQCGLCGNEQSLTIVALSRVEKLWEGSLADITALKSDLWGLSTVDWLNDFFDLALDQICAYKIGVSLLARIIEELDVRHLDRLNLVESRALNSLV